MQKLLIQRHETDLTFPQVIKLQKYYRQSLPPDSLGPAMEQALRDMAAQMGFASRPHQPVPTPPKKAKREVITPRVKCEVHREKVFVFSDGTVWQCCTHDECLFGKGRKTHSDRLPHPPVEVEDEPEVELSSDDPRELSLDRVVQPLDDSDIEDAAVEIVETETGTIENDLDEDEASAYSNQDWGRREC